MICCMHDTLELFVGWLAAAAGGYYEHCAGR